MAAGSNNQPLLTAEDLLAQFPGPVTLVPYRKPSSVAFWIVLAVLTALGFVCFFVVGDKGGMIFGGVLLTLCLFACLFPLLARTGPRGATAAYGRLTATDV